MRATLLFSAVALACWAVAGCGGESAARPGPVHGNRVIAYTPVVGAGVTSSDWPYFFAPELTLGPPGDVFEVASLGYDPEAGDALGGSITLGLGDPEDQDDRFCAADGAGTDLAVYENPFLTTDPASGVEGVSNEVATVEVSADGVNWYRFPAEVDEALPLISPERYMGFAGVTPTADGGDRFDLGQVVAVHGLAEDFRACYVRLTDGGTRFQDYGNTQSDLFASGADINAVEAFYPERADGLTP